MPFLLNLFGNGVTMINQVNKVTITLNIRDIFNK